MTTIIRIQNRMLYITICTASCFLLCDSEQKKRQSKWTVSLCWRLPIFPGRRQPSIFGTSELNCRVRNGNGWTLTVINTNYVIGTNRILLSHKPVVKKNMKTENGDPWESRTPVWGVRGPRLNHLTNGPRMGDCSCTFKTEQSFSASKAACKFL